MELIVSLPCLHVECMRPFGSRLMRGMQNSICMDCLTKPWKGLCKEIEFMSDSKQIPLSLGKPSLRVRLEAYYSLIEPSRLRDKTSWRKIVDEIYKKVRIADASHGEKNLSSRLVKKYGSNVKLLLAESSARESLSSAEATFPIENEQFEETWYNPSTKRDGGIDLFSEMLDPEAVLIASEGRDHFNMQCVLHFID
eukprot:scaffold2243_cov122-Cylindrotheca_fusiformis.AAC.21